MLYDLTRRGAISATPRPSVVAIGLGGVPTRHRDHLDGRVTGYGQSKVAVRGDERYLEHLGERDVDDVVRREVVTELPRTRHEVESWIPGYGQHREVVERFADAVGVHVSPTFETPEGVDDLDIDEIRCDRGIGVVEYMFLHDVGTRKTEQEMRYR